jgi:hypothetical protein
MASRDQKPPSSHPVDPYAEGDLIPTPEAVENSGESVWALFSEIAQQHDNRFADTAPAPRSVTLPAAGEVPGWAKTRPMPKGMSLPPARRFDSQPLFTLDAAMLVARRNNRVCPRPERWEEFSALLPSRKTMRGVEAPPAPMTGAAWAVTPPLTKRLCFREQIEWAESHGVLENVMAFMQQLREEDWLHMGED